MNAQVDGTGSDSSPGAARADFAAGIDSPVSTASSHSNRVVSSSRMSAGTTFPMPQRDDVAGDEFADVDAPLGAVAPRQRLMADVVVQARPPPARTGTR